MSRIPFLVLLALAILFVFAILPWIIVAMQWLGLVLDWYLPLIIKTFGPGGP